MRIFAAIATAALLAASPCMAQEGNSDYGHDASRRDDHAMQQDHTVQQNHTVQQDHAARQGHVAPQRHAVRQDQHVARQAPARGNDRGAGRSAADAGRHAVVVQHQDPRADAGRGTDMRDQTGR
jgi:hypothetical protein